MKRKFSLLSLALLVLSASAMSAAKADVNIVSDYGNTAAGTAFFRSDMQKLAQRFTIGATSVTLSSATLRLSVVAGKGGPMISPVVSLYSDAAGTPGSSIGLLGSQVVTSTTPIDVTFTPISGIGLFANTSYWIELEDNSGGGGFWSMVSNGSTSDIGAVLGPNAASPTGVTNWTTSSTSSLQMSLQSSGVVPESGSLPLMAFAGSVPIAAVWLKRRRRPIL